MAQTVLLAAAMQDEPDPDKKVKHDKLPKHMMRAWRDWHKQVKGGDDGTG